MNRSQLYKHFGPKLLEAIVLIIKDEVNILRDAAGLSERTNEQIMSAIENRLGSASDYDWTGEI